MKTNGPHHIDEGGNWVLKLSVHEALAREDLCWIDVRSPGEYASSSIPGSINIPLFNDEEHRLIGTTYHHGGSIAARQKALALLSPRLPELVRTIISASKDKTPLLYCQRGGMRSQALWQVLDLAGVPAARLEKGYQAFRRHIYNRLTNYHLRGRLVVLHGLTGVGKTALLQILTRRGQPIIDLEGLARHRGSVFGAVGLEGQRSQKDFDALLLQQLDNHAAEPFIIIEGEGRRIGNIYLPRFLAQAMTAGRHILLTAPLSIRVARIVSEYAALDQKKTKEQLHQAICSLEKRLGSSKTRQLLESLAANDYYTTAEMLCRDYYDCHYRDSRPETANFDCTIDTSSLEDAAEQIIAITARVL